MDLRVNDQIQLFLVKLQQQKTFKFFLLESNINIYQSRNIFIHQLAQWARTSHSTMLDHFGLVSQKLLILKEKTLQKLK